jgi:Family of unknown function (DUF5947)
MTAEPVAGQQAGQSASDPLAVLRRIRSGRPLPPPGERCEMCGEAIPADEETLLPRASGRLGHSHVVDMAARRLLCTCRACALLFTAEGADLAYRAVPNRYLALPALDADWDSLQIPVGLAFFFVNSTLGRTVGCYPSPAGATESQLPLDSWSELVNANPALTELRPDVEALLVRTREGEAADSYLVPIDACYALVGRLRQLWRGFDGGSEVRTLLTSLFAELAAVARPAPRPEQAR